MKTPHVAKSWLLTLALLGPMLASAQQDAPLEPKEKGYAKLTGIDMYYEIYGEGDPVLLLHGSFWPIAFTWGELIPALAKNRKVIAVELDGHGHTPLTDRDMTYALHAKDVAEAIRYLKFDQVDVFGYSFGGTVALQLIVDNPDLVNKAIIMSTAHHHQGWHPSVWDNIREFKPDFLDQTPIKALYDSIAPNPADWTKFITKQLAFELKPFDVGYDNIKAIQTPILYLMGDNDGVSNEQKMAFMEAADIGRSGDTDGLPPSQMLILPGRTHVGLGMETEMLMQHITPFLDGILADKFLRMMQQ
ncbi:alpha/beta fold hydrolase [Parapedobacter deserti]|uniref:Alpha/beta fold hydrolase n=1 Tax=Parapedobacter deserti TaxID=1912957 RepID=A0ABV7JML7_9SPHI